MLGRLEHQRGNFDAALQVLQGIDIRSLMPRMTTAIADSVKPRGPPRSRKKTSQVNGMLMHMSMHSVSLLLEAILLKAKSLEGLGRVTGTDQILSLCFFFSYLENDLFVFTILNIKICNMKFGGQLQALGKELLL